MNEFQNAFVEVCAPSFHIFGTFYGIYFFKNMLSKSVINK